MCDRGKGDAEKARYWQRTISEAAQSGTSIRQLALGHLEEVAAADAGVRKVGEPVGGDSV